MYTRKKEARKKTSRAAAHQGSQPVQRRILLDGRAVVLADYLRRARDPKERVILSNWGWSKTDHNFQSTKDGTSAKQRLLAALASARSQVKDVPALYSASNLMFLTKAGGRMPTLYFKSGSDSGRIRQQHGGGPKVVREKNKTDYFFTDQKKMHKFYKAAKYARKNDQNFKPRLSKYGASKVPGADNFHIEVTYAGKKIKKLHMSGGLIDPGISNYDDNTIKSIYQSAIGFTT